MAQLTMNKSRMSWLGNLIDSGRRQFASGLSGRGLHSARLGMETLEDRCMLSVVPVFERIEGDVHALADVFAGAGGLGPFYDSMTDDGEPDEIVAYAEAHATADGVSANQTMTAVSGARIPPDPPGFPLLPFPGGGSRIPYAGVRTKFDAEAENEDGGGATVVGGGTSISTWDVDTEEVESLTEPTMRIELLVKSDGEYLASHDSVILTTSHFASVTTTIPGVGTKEWSITATPHGSFTTAPHWDVIVVTPDETFGFEEFGELNFSISESLPYDGTAEVEVESYITDINGSVHTGIWGSTEEVIHQELDWLATSDAWFWIEDRPPADLDPPNFPFAPLTPPQVTNVIMSGSDSTHDPYSFYDVVGAGEQLRTVPVGGLDTISISFSEIVEVTEGALTLVGMQGQTIYAVESFTYNLGTLTATWQLDDVLEPGHYLIQLDDSIVDLDDFALDGEFDNPWSLYEGDGISDTFPSGNGVAGGDFEFRFTTLPGDFNHDNIVDGDDEDIWEANDDIITTGAEHADGDADGDGDVDDDDWDIWDASPTNDFATWPGAILVSTLTDEKDTDYSLGDLSLREALVIAANNTTNPGLDVIVFRDTLASGMITLAYDGADAGTTPDTLTVDSDVTIEGLGADLLSISGNDLTRVFTLEDGNAVTIRGLTITGGRVTGSNNGGGIYNEADLTLDSVVVADNLAYGHGGGLYSTDGHLVIRDSTFEENTANSTGGGLRVVVSTTNGLEVINSAFIGNEAAGTSGGGLFIAGDTNAGNVSITNSTISGNTAELYNGGIRVFGDILLEFTNSTIAYNAGEMGGGIGTGSSGQVLLHNTIVAMNDDPNNLYHDISGGTLDFDSASSYNLIGDDPDESNGIDNGENHNQVGGEDSDPTIDPQLAVLANYGGPTKTHALESNSPAIDQGSDAEAEDANDDPLTVDQRGFDRFVDDPNTTDGAGGTVDIGAFEFGAPVIVSTIADENDGNYSYGDLSLREALALDIPSYPGLMTIEFDPVVFGKTITLSHASGFGELTTADVNIVGPGADLLTIDANSDATNKHRVFNLPYSGSTIEISGLTITGGDAGTGYGGGIFSNSYLSLSDVRVVANKAAYGGGIAVLDGGLNIVGSEINNNTAGTGGGLYFSNNDAELLIDSSTIAWNEADSGGGIFAAGDILITNSTVSSNEGGGLRLYASEAEGEEAVLVNVTVANNTASYGNFAGIDASGSDVPVTLYNTIVANNFVGSVQKDIYGTFDGDSSNNLIGLDTNTSNGIENGSDGNQVGVSNAIDPLLSILGYYGGPTRTHILLNNSPAIDAGDNDIAITYDLDYDQRGEDRIVDWMDDDEPIVDIGAVELAFDEVYS